jgi:aspartate aminotransferase
VPNIDRRPRTEQGFSVVFARIGTNSNLKMKLAKSTGSLIKSEPPRDDSWRSTLILAQKGHFGQCSNYPCVVHFARRILAGPQGSIFWSSNPMFEHLTTAPDDPILGLNEKFKQDQRPHRVNLIVGVYQDETGEIPEFQAVSEARRRINSNVKANYLGIDGDPAYSKLASELLLGAESPRFRTGNWVAAQSLGGTGGLRVVADFLARCQVTTTIWHTNPTWVNHQSIFNAAGLQTKAFPYLDAAGKGLDFVGMLAALEQIPSGDAVLLHGCCHNPTGVDPSPDQWQAIIDVLKQRRLLPILDCAYQGFGDGLEADVLACRLVSQQMDEAVIVQSFSKNFSLYNQRVGAVLFLTKDQLQANTLRSQVKAAIRANYSNPPQYGAALVRTVLADTELRANWQNELESMRLRIATLRRRFSASLQEKCDHDFSHIAKQSGMFSFSGLTPEQVTHLRDEFGIYFVGNGRMNVAGLNESNLEVTTRAIAEVVGRCAVSAS